MLLVVDAGNTNVTLGVFRREQLVAQGRLLTDHEKTGDQYKIEIKEFLRGAGIDSQNIEAIAISSVVPQLDPKLKQIAADEFGVAPLFVDSTTDIGLVIRYDQPAEVGADRLVDAAAAVAKYGAPCLVVDFGTATTFNAINADREYLGGVIAPGLMISAEALFSRAAKLPRVKIERPAKVIGSSTVGAIQSGLYHGYAGLVDGVLQQMIAEMQSKPIIIATGGLAPLIAEASNLIQKIDATLTLDGLRVVYERSLPK